MIIEYCIKDIGRFYENLKPIVNSVPLLFGMQFNTRIRKGV